jgi:hypothetical protein
MELVEWLSQLKEGDLVKVKGKICRVSRFVDMFGKRALVILNKDHDTFYFDLANGIRLGNNKGVYLDSVVEQLSYA